MLEIKHEIKHEDILTDVLLPIKFLQSIIFSLDFLNNEICLGFLSKKGTGKNEVTRNLCSSVVEKFNGYEMIRQDLASKERVDIDDDQL